MPTYEYVCDKCGHSFEMVQSMKDKALSLCPKELCGRKTWGRGKVRRAIGAGAGLIFKGSGFYITDYRSENYKNAAKKDVAAPAAAPATSTSTSESKPAPAKTESSGASGARKTKS